MTPDEFREARRKLGLPPSDLAPLLGVAPARAAKTLSEWQRGIGWREDGPVARLMGLYLRLQEDAPHLLPADWPNPTQMSARRQG